MGEARGGIFRMADRDLLELLDAPQVSVLADGAQIEARDPERLGAHFGIPAVEAPEEQVRRSIGELARLDRVQIIDQEQKTSRSEA
jgi:hypothetical protein